MTPAHGSEHTLRAHGSPRRIYPHDRETAHVMAFIFYVTHIHLGYDALAMLDSECTRVGIKRPLIITDKGVLAAGLVSQTVQAMHLDAGAVPIFDETPSNPTEAMVMKAAALYKR